MPLPNLFQHFNCTKPDIRREAPESAAQRLHQLDRQADAVMNKLVKVYGIDPNDWDDHHLRDDARLLAEQVMDDPRTHALQDRAQVSYDALHSALRDGIMGYFEVFHTMEAVTRRESTVRPGYEAYDAFKDREDMACLYMNHRTNAAEARLIAAGFDPVDAHTLNGRMIRTAIHYAQFNISKGACILPPQGRPENEAHAVRQIGELRNDWKERATTLQRIIKRNQAEAGNDRNR